MSGLVLRIPLGLLLAALATLVSLIPVGSAHAAPPRVAADFFGVTLQAPTYQGDDLRRRQIDAFSGVGIRHVRINLSWSVLEPLPPSGDRHDYRWAATDERIGDLARRNVRPQGLITQSPTWAADDTRDGNSDPCLAASSRRPRRIADYVDLTRAIARRYGRGGAFWDAHPGIDPKPIVRFEIWNEPNLRGSWCPEPQPSVYARMFVQSARAIRDVNPAAEVMIGGMAFPKVEGPYYLNPSTFLARAVASNADLVREASAVPVHVYPATDPNLQLKKVAAFRAELRKGRIPDRVPMLINELGWSTYGGNNPVPEPDRAQGFAHAATKLSRTNCNVIGLLPHTWNSEERNGSNYQHFFGIAHPNTAELYPSAEAFSRGVTLMRGELSERPPTETLAVCPGMPLPDQDGDGTPDEDDYYPLDRDRTKPGDKGGGGGGGGGGTAADTTRKCTARLLQLTSRIASSTERSERNLLKRRFKRVERRCVPCKRRMASIRRRMQDASATGKATLRVRYRRIRRQCRPCTRRLHSLQTKWFLADTDAERGTYERRHQRLLRRRCGR